MDAGPVALFLEPRLLAYFVWHPVTVRGVGSGPFRKLVPALSPFFVNELRQWERLHPSLPLPAAVA